MEKGEGETVVTRTHSGTCAPGVTGSWTDGAGWGRSAKDSSWRKGHFSGFRMLFSRRQKDREEDISERGDRTMKVK